MVNLRHFRVSVILLLLILSSPGICENIYILTDLGSDGEGRSIALGLNDNGNVVGLRDFDGALHAVYWKNGTLIDLGTLGGPESHATDINSSDQVVGITSNAALETRGFLWDEFVGMVDLGTLGGPQEPTDAAARAINDAGQVVGESAPPSSPFRHATFWDGTGNVEDLGLLDDGPWSYARDINASGLIVGYSYSPLRAILWNSGSLQNLGTLGGNVSQAFGVNSQGEVVGHSTLADESRRAFIWTASEGMQDIGTLGGETKADRINDASQVVGYSNLPDGTRHAFLWEASTEIQDLNSLVDNEDWVLARALDINEIGQIVGYGYLNGSNSTRAFLISPAQSIEVDLDPSKDPNKINLRSKGKTVSVAMITSSTFDALQIDPASVMLGDSASVSYEIKDFDRDGDADLITFHDISSLGLFCSDVSLDLIGKLYGGLYVTGSDSVELLNCK